MASPLLQSDAVQHSSPWNSKPELRSAALLERIAKQSPLARITAASRLEVHPAPETVSSGILQIDTLAGGIPRGCLTEICGPESSGRTTVLLSALAAATRREEICALIDASDSFDPLSAAAAGLDLPRLLWVRCGSPSRVMSRKRRPAASLEEWQQRRMEDPVEQALRAADLLLQSRGFGLVVVDLAGVSAKMARRIPLTTWFRFRRAVENTPTILLVIGVQPCAESCASLVLKLGQEAPNSQFSVLCEKQSPDNPQGCPGDGIAFGKKPSHAELLTGIDIQTEVLRSCSERKSVQSVSAFPTKTAWTA